MGVEPEPPDEPKEEAGGQQIRMDGEEKLIGCPADDAPSTVSLPDLQLDMGGNNTAPCCLRSGRNIQVFLTLRRYELEFEYLASIADLSPSVNKMEYTIVRPDALTQLLIHPNAFR